MGKEKNKHYVLWTNQCIQLLQSAFAFTQLHVFKKYIKTLINGYSFHCVSDTSRCACKAPAPWWTQGRSGYVGHPGTPEHRDKEQHISRKDVSHFWSATSTHVESPWSFCPFPRLWAEIQSGPQDLSSNMLVLGAQSWWRVATSLGVFLHAIFLNILTWHSMSIRALWFDGTLLIFSPDPAVIDVQFKNTYILSNKTQSDSVSLQNSHMSTEALYN